MRSVVGGRAMLLASSYRPKGVEPAKESPLNNSRLKQDNSKVNNKRKAYYKKSNAVLVNLKR